MHSQNIINTNSLVSKTILERHSGKSYDSAKSIKWEIVEAVSIAASRAFTSYNLQPYYCIFCFRSVDENDEKTKKYFSTAASLDTAAFNSCINSLYGNSMKNWVQKAPLIVLFVERTKYSKEDAMKNTYIKEGETNPHHAFDTGAAAMNMALQATEQGLMAHPVGGFDHAKIRSSFNIPENDNPRILMTLGYETKDTQESRSNRNPLSTNFFIGNLKNPME